MSNYKYYDLESEEIYKIKVPWRHLYKASDDEPSGWKSFAVYINKLSLNGKLPQWKENCSVEKYVSDKRKINYVRELAIHLKNNDTYLYSSAVFYVIGLLSALPKNELFNTMGIESIVPYCIDWSYDGIGELLDVFNTNDGFSDFTKTIPTAFAMLPIQVGGNYSSDKQAIARDVFVLFDFMIEYTLLLNHIIRDANYIVLARQQILHYYKFLRKNKIYPPYELQEKLYNDIQF